MSKDTSDRVSVSRISLLGCAALALSSPATAQIIESSTIKNAYSYKVGSQQGSNADAPNNVSLILSDTTNGYQSDMALVLTSSLNNGEFFFLHNGYCVGNCSVKLSTDIVFTLTNPTESPLAVRFDSLITPGHLATSNFFGASALQRGNYLFNVTQDTTRLYESNGLNSLRPPFPTVRTSDEVPFNNLLRTDNSPDWNVLDWSATNLNIDLLPIGAGETTTLTYHSEMLILTNDMTCRDTLECLGYQVAFGDPRNRGGTTLESARTASFAALAEPLFPAVGAPYDLYRVSTAFVPQGSPLPPPPPQIPALFYNVPYRPLQAAVPEPATWGMMLIGFAAIGSITRRRAGARMRFAAA